MDDLKSYAVFAETVSAGSMSAAGRRLGMSPSAVSQTIRALERRAGVALLHRSTRKLTLTEAGERCYPHCRHLLEAARLAAASLAEQRDVASGELRIAAPVGFAPHVGSALGSLLARSPSLRLRLLVDDAMIDLIDAQIDIAIRVGEMADSNLLARRLCDLEMILCAAPSYVLRRVEPGNPGELPDHDWLALARETMEPHGSATDATERSPTLWLDLHRATGERQRVRVDVRIASNNLLALQQMCEQGLGVARLPHADVAPALAEGTLVRLLPQWRFTPMPVRAVTSGRDSEPAKVRLAVQALKDYFTTLPGLAPRVQ